MPLPIDDPFTLKLTMLPLLVTPLVRNEAALGAVVEKLAAVTAPLNVPLTAPVIELPPIARLPLSVSAPSEDAPAAAIESAVIASAVSASRLVDPVTVSVTVVNEVAKAVICDCRLAISAEVA